MPNDRNWGSGHTFCMLIQLFFLQPAINTSPGMLHQELKCVSGNETCNSNDFLEIQQTGTSLSHMNMESITSITKHSTLSSYHQINRHLQAIYEATSVMYRTWILHPVVLRQAMKAKQDALRTRQRSAWRVSSLNRRDTQVCTVN
jgi:hypothetical protein